MELRKVNDNYTRKYAKNDEITKEELKKFTPKKWLTASAIGLATIFYTSPKDSPLRIGVVFGCVSLNDEENINPANHTVPFITLAVIILGTIFFIYYTKKYLFNKKDIITNTKNEKEPITLENDNGKIATFLLSAVIIGILAILAILILPYI